MKMSGAFRVSVWDPPLIIAQIVSVQCILYVSLGIWVILFLHLLCGQPISVDYIFKYQEVNVKDVTGRLVIISFVVNALVSAASLWAIVQRTKLCLDFSATAYVIHLVACVFYNFSWPTSAAWWILQISCLVITCVIGEYLCMRTELKAIPLGMSSPMVDL